MDHFSMSIQEYCKVANRNTSHLVAPPRIFRLIMKGKFDVYLLRPLGEKFIFEIVAKSTLRDSMV